MTQQTLSEFGGLDHGRKYTCARRLLYARALLLCGQMPPGPGWTVACVPQALGVATRTIEHLKQRFVEGRRTDALRRRQMPLSRRDEGRSGCQLPTLRHSLFSGRHGRDESASQQLIATCTRLPRSNPAKSRVMSTSMCVTAWLTASWKWKP